MKFIFLIFFVCGCAAYGEVWTNVAGHSIQAELLNVNGNRALFRRPNGKIFQMPIKGLAKAEQKRVFLQFPTPITPDSKERAHARFLERLNLLHRKGRLSDEEYVQQRALFSKK